MDAIAAQATSGTQNKEENRISRNATTHQMGYIEVDHDADRL